MSHPSCSSYPSLIVRTPNTREEFRHRDQLLQTSLWEDSSSPHAITKEYPLVLSPENSRYSHCFYDFYDQNQLVAHANLLPREVISNEGKVAATIGLVGNVVTTPEFRGRGYMHKVFHHLTNIAQESDLQALLLWSDLDQFYQKLGFSSLGREYRFVITKQSFAKTNSPPQGWRQSTTADYDLLSLRPGLPFTIKRSAEEFRALLTIPDTHLFIKESLGKVCAFIIVGKGHDMTQVAHEWGAESPDTLLEGARFICESKGYDWLMVLSPTSANRFNQQLKKQSHSCEEHAMALFRPLTSTRSSLRLDESVDLFIWGLDSI